MMGQNFLHRKKGKVIISNYPNLILCALKITGNLCNQFSLASLYRKVSSLCWGFGEIWCKSSLDKLKKAGLPTDYKFATTLTKKEKQKLKVPAYTCPDCTAVSRDQCSYCILLLILGTIFLCLSGIQSKELTERK